ncbi:4Fe-4S binding protein [Noviherbaspirillum pedocola]|uniref:4Fe-4S binding protein n=1 Tax=Noviherbaspirillum pedocola TaxID=2801341 RepID=A0A934SR55_9BURK|nr:4Fe-4S binding protein [Noviherbaspirillum pedocola]MBK4734017.1 4Fe-4S binding protein [Noviherbaspirillum pedocola]
MNRPLRFHSLLRLFLALLALTLTLLSTAHAGVMTRDALKSIYPSPYQVGEKDAALPVWPVFRQNATETQLVGYVFESMDLAPIPGFSGVPANLLILLDAKGNFLDVRVLSQHEPVFLEGLGPAPLDAFVAQYRGLSLTDSVRIDTPPRAGGKREGGAVHLDGVAKATASVRIINQSVLSSALKVARAKLGFSGASDPDRVARVNTEVLETRTLAQLEAEGMVAHQALTNAQVEAAYAGSDGEGLDAVAKAEPQALFSEAYIALASVPSIGRNLLTEAAWKRLSDRLEPGDHALLVFYRGRYGVIGEDFTAGTVPDRLLIKQSGLNIEMRDLDLELKPRESALAGMSMRVFRVIAQAGLDPAQPLDVTLLVRRSKGVIYPERIDRAFHTALRLPTRFVVLPPEADGGWSAPWRARWPELALLAAGLAVLAIALARQRALTANARRFAWFRQGYLLFTAIFIGWYAQGQLSIVNITGALQALREGRGLGFLLYDPMTVSLWAFVLVSLVVWGRGTFCGWLCPFGALQEFVGKAAHALRIPQLRLSRAADARLKLIKYGVLAAIIGSVFLSTALTDSLVEAEPFKTAITLGFVRSWPFVLYAVLLLAASAFVYKAFCRYLCPFGAGLALLGRMRLFNWLPRRAECGQPCQTCRHRCDYGAIERDGRVRYDECFQCMDCVVIYHSDAQCAPRILEKKRARVVPIRAVEKL